MKHKSNKTWLGFFGLALIAGFAFPALSQEVTNQDIADRMDKLEHDLMVLQRQAARGHSDTDSDQGTTVQSSDVPPPAGADAASLQVEISNIEDEMHKLRGRVEENEFQMRQMSDKLNKFQQDTETRLTDMANAQAAAAAAAKAAPPAPPATPAHGSKESEKTADNTPSEGRVDTSSEAHEIKESDADSPAATTAGNGVLEKPSDTQEFDTPRDEYNYAFRLLNQTRYDDAAKYFDEFISKYPKDPLIGNAHYWLGETYYIRHDYVKAADSFRQGFEVLPNGPKAADNLLKLSMSLSAMNKTKDACVVLDQLSLKFKESSPSVVQKAQSERNRIGCK